MTSFQTGVLVGVLAACLGPPCIVAAMVGVGALWLRVRRWHDRRTLILSVVATMLRKRKAGAGTTRNNEGPTPLDKLEPSAGGHSPGSTPAASDRFHIYSFTILGRPSPARPISALALPDYQVFTAAAEALRMKHHNNDHEQDGA